jgi:hypothetical protein
MGAMHMESHSRKQWTDTEKAEVVAAYQRSGLSLCAFAKRHGIAPANIQRWVQQHEAAGPCTTPTRTALIEVPNLLAARPGPGVYRVHFPHGLQLEITRGFDPLEVRALVQLCHHL